MKWLLTTLCCCLTISGVAQNANLKPNREAHKLTVLVDAEAAYVDSVKAGPFVVGPNILQLYPGETVFVEVEEANGSVTKLQVVQENKRPERTVEIAFSQEANGCIHEQMMLKVVNPFKKDLTYSAMMYLLQQKKWVETSVLPVRAGLTSYETWPDIIVTVALADWKFAK